MMARNMQLPITAFAGILSRDTKHKNKSISSYVYLYAFDVEFKYSLYATRVYSKYYLNIPI